jgi:hypothetical protein
MASALAAEGAASSKRAKSPEIEGMGVLVASAGPICYPWSMPQASRHLFDSRPNAAS